MTSKCWQNGDIKIKGHKSWITQIKDASSTGQLMEHEQVPILPETSASWDRVPYSSPIL